MTKDTVSFLKNSFNFFSSSIWVKKTLIFIHHHSDIVLFMYYFVGFKIVINL